MLMSQEYECERETRPARILHLEDKELDRELVSEMIHAAGIDCEITAVETREGFVSRLDDEPWDVILSDYTLPTFDGLEALGIALKICPDTPFIFVTGTMGEDKAVESLKSGATDYVLKQGMKRLAGSVRRAMGQRAEKQRREEIETELTRSEERLRFLAYHDALTSLPNRALFKDRLAQALADARRRDEKIALLFIDLDRFKDVNDSLGHSAGDLVLQHVAEQLIKCARNNDTVARLGGDEFVVVLSAIKDSTDAVIAAIRIKRELANEFMVNGAILSTTCSMGISVYPMDGGDAETLLKNADAALFSAKDGGRNGWQFFTQEMNDRAIQRLKMETALRPALEKKQFSLDYQPQLDLISGKIVGAEALLRWRHPEMGLIPPNTFIPVAETTGEIIPIGEWVLRTACTQAKKWQEEGMADLVVAVNVSAIQLRHGSLPAAIKCVLEETGLAPKYLELEITESLLLTRSDEITAQMVKLREMGLSLALDDFGTGYSSFSYARRFRFDKLKVDGSFIQSLCVNENDAHITAAIIGMGKILNMKVIAECVETEDQVDFLRSHGCDEVQGYHFGRPVSAAIFAEKFRSFYVPLPV
jgi:diguanylate cyclase (GGDEF)-like protein